jgi:hypothetical protein
MKRVRGALLAGLIGGCALLVAAGPAAAAPGGGADVVPTTCLITLPGIGTAVGTGKVVFIPSGGQALICNARLEEGATLPSRAVTIANGVCVTLVTPSGNVVAHCRP